jgi:hypothetical protein
MEAKMNTLTLRKIPLSVERGIRRLASETQQSLNKTAIELLAKGVGIDSKSSKLQKRRDIKSVIPLWSKEEYEEFQNNTRQFGSIDKELWHS